MPNFFFWHSTCDIIVFFGRFVYNSFCQSHYNILKHDPRVGFKGFSPEISFHFLIFYLFLCFFNLLI